MCGILGWIGQTSFENETHLNQVSDALRHRGPDDEGQACGEGWGLGFRRLSILDLTDRGHQPMCSADKKHWIVFNGEIYNYLELRHDLEGKGESFYSQSDTEVLLRLLMREGEKCLTRLNGMFAFAYLNQEENTFLLARDRLGVKPLYYQFVNNQIRFASELKGLLAWPGAKPTIDLSALVTYLALNYLPVEKCIFKEYRKLAAATYLKGSLSNPHSARDVRYWQIEINSAPDRRSLSEADHEELADLLTDAVRIRLRSDVPVGVFLSGGIDSGLVASLSARTVNGQRPIAFTVCFDETRYDEKALAVSTARFSRLEHRLIHQGSGSLDDLDRLTWFYDEPFADASALPVFSLCEAASRHGKVFLSGDGGDESFSGYRRYIEARRYAWLGQVPRPISAAMRATSKLLPPLSLVRYRLLKSGLGDGRFAAAFDGLPEDPALATILSDDLRVYASEAGKSLWERWSTANDGDLTARQQALDYSLYLPDDILVKVDRASMAHSVEIRSPFLDYRLVEWAAGKPRSAFLNSTEGKLPLRRLAKTLLPVDVQSGQKRGFDVPLDDWFRNQKGQAFVRERLLSREAIDRGWWRPRAIEHLLRMHARGGSRQFSSWFWRLLVLDSWARHYYENRDFKNMCRK